MVEGVAGIPPEELSRRLGGPGRAARVWELLRRGLDPFTELPSGPRARLAAVARPTATSLRATTVAADGTVKLLLSLPSGGEVESVVIPGRARTTLCISTQVGCARGCIFCLTGTMGRVRDLAADEIVAQVLHARQVARARELPPLRNVVVMGMGEPLDNLGAVAPALRVLVSDRGLRMPARNLTVSTVGPSPARILEAETLPGRLAWSVHAAEDSLRRRLVPTTRHRMAELRDAFAEVVERRREPLFVEVTLLRGVNDRPEHARALVELLAPVPTEVRVNLLPMNPIGNELEGSASATVDAFGAIVREAGIFTTVRRARGDERRAACGQLAVEGRPAGSVPRAGSAGG